MVKKTQVMPVVDCSEQEQLRRIMAKCGTARALTYNKLDSLIVRTNRLHIGQIRVMQKDGQQEGEQLMDSMGI